MKGFAIGRIAMPTRDFHRTQKEAGISHIPWEWRLSPPEPASHKAGEFLVGVLIGAGLLMVML